MVNVLIRNIEKGKIIRKFYPQPDIHPKNKHQELVSELQVLYEGVLL